MLSTQWSFEAPCHLTCASLYRLKAARGLLQVVGLLYGRHPHSKSIDGTPPSVGLPNTPSHVRNPKSSYDDLLSCSSSPICTLGMGQFQDQSPEGLSDPRPSEALSSHQWSGVFVSLLTFNVQALTRWHYHAPRYMHPLLLQEVQMLFICSVMPRE